MKENENLRLAFLYYDARAYKDALEYCNQGLKEEPENPHAIFLSGQLNYRFGNLEESMAAFSRMIELYPFCDEAFFNRGNIMMELGNFVGAVPDFDEAIRLQPELDKYYYLRALCKQKLDDHLGAFADLSETLAICPWNTIARHDRAILLQELGEYGFSIEEFLKVEDADRSCISATIYRGVSLALTGKEEEGLKMIGKVIKEIPDYEDAYLERGRIYRNKQDYEKALDDFTMTIDLTHNKLGYLERGITFLEAGNNVDAMIDFNKAIEKDPEYAPAYLNLGIARANLEDHQGAVEAFDKAIKLDRFQTKAWKMQRLSLEQLGNSEDLIKNRAGFESFMN